MWCPSFSTTINTTLDNNRAHRIVVGSNPPTRYYKVIDTVHNMIQKENRYVSINEKEYEPKKSPDKLTNRVIKTNGEVDDVY